MNRLHMNPERALLIRLGTPLRAHKAYIPPEQRLREYLRFSQERDGKMLYVFNRKMQTVMAQSGHIIFFSEHTPLMVTADIGDVGGPYSPRTWNPLDPYQVPEIDNEPSRHYVQLNDVRRLTDFDPSDWMVESQHQTAPLDEMLERRMYSSVRGSEGKETVFYTKLRCQLLVIVPKNSRDYSDD